MKVKKTLHVEVSDGELEVRMGRALTSIYFKGQEKAVFRANEIDTLISLLQKGKEELATFMKSLEEE